MTVYTVVNEKEKVRFEKTFEIPYGYNNCPIFVNNFSRARRWFKNNLGKIERKNHIIERHNAGRIDIVYRGA